MDYLIFQTAFIGDALLTIPLIKNLNKLNPNRKPSIVCRHSLVPLFEGLGLVDKAYGLDKTNKLEWQTLKSELTKKSWDTVFCPHQSLRSAYFIQKIKCQNRLGFKKWWNTVFFNQRVNYDLELPEPVRVLKMLSLQHPEIHSAIETLASDIKQKNISSIETIFTWPYAIPEWANMKVVQNLETVNSTHHKFQVTENSIFIAPGSVWATKRWQIEGYAELSSQLSAEGYNLFITGDKSDEALANKIIKANPKAKSLCGKTSLLELHALFSRAKMIISNDSSPIHMAALAGAPVVSIFGPTTLDLGYRPWTENSVVVQKSLTCRPCGKHGHNTCPIKTHACMKSIGANEVLNAVKRLLA